MKKNLEPLVSIIIPLHVITERFFIDLEKYSRLQYTNYEILIITDIPIVYKKSKKVRIFVTGLDKTGPAEKRDFALKQCKGKYCAFIDDDAFPDTSWLTQGISNFQTSTSIVAVGGPGITPPNEPFMSALGGLVYESVLTSGKAKHRFISKGQQKKFTYDWPAYNLIVRTDVLKKVGGYDCTFYGGEDTFLCLKLIKEGKIVYDPTVIVYHHRRPLFISHLRQIHNIGIHRGYFFKKFPETSRKMFYVLPTFLTVGLFGLICFSLLYPSFIQVFVIGLLLFWLFAYVTVLGKTTPVGTIFVSFGILLTHISYGIGFLEGLFTENLLR